MMAQVSGLPGATLSQMENSTWIIVVLEIIFLHEGKEEGMTFKRWEKTTLMSHVCSCIAVLASNQFFFVCIAVLASNQFFFLFVLLCWHPTTQQLPPVVAPALGAVKKEQPSPSVSESPVSNFLCLLL